MLPECIKDKGKVDEGGEHRVEFVVAGEHAPVSFEPPEESLDFVAAAVSFAVQSPPAQTQGVGRHHRSVAK